MAFLEANQGKAMDVLLQKFSAIRDNEGYDRLNEMRAWYASDLNPGKEKWGLRPRIAMDKILHRDEDPAPGWLLGDCERAQLTTEQYDLIKNRFGG